MKSKQSKRIRNIIAVFMASVLVFVAFFGSNQQVKAEEKEEDLVSKYYGPVDGIELPELRDECGKHYLLPDGSMQYVGNPDRIHYLDEQGVYQDIDNHIIDETSWIEGTHFTKRNRANDLIIRFAEESEGTNDLIRIEYKNSAISFRPESVVCNRVNFENYDLRDLIDFVNPDYCVVYITDQGYDLVYQVTENGLKEYIIVRSAATGNRFSFEYSFENLDLEQDESGSSVLYFTDVNGEKQFATSRLYAFDQSGALTEQVYFDIAQTGVNDRIDVLIDNEWISNPDRSFPLVIDPTTMITGEYVTYDTFTCSLYPNNNYYLSDYLRIGIDDDFGTRYSFIKFDLPSIASSSVTSAYINLRMSACDGTPYMYARRCVTSWSSDTLKWNNMPTPSYDSGDTSNVAVYDYNHDDTNWYTMKDTTLVKKWLAGTANNYGVWLFNAPENASVWATYYSSDYGYPNRPELVINYTS